MTVATGIVSTPIGTHAGYKQINRVEDRILITGQGNYVDDRKIPDMLFAAVLRSPYAHADLQKIDISKAIANPKVLAIITQEDAASMTRPLPVRDPSLIEGHQSEEFCLAVGKVRYYGEPVAAVAAVTPQDAMDAIEDIEVEYVQRTAVVDPESASKHDSPLIFDSYGTNIVAHYDGQSGDIEFASKKSDVTVRTRVRIGGYNFTPLETMATVAKYSRQSGQLTIWSNAQVFGELIKMVSSSLGIPTNRIRAIDDNIGGGFGIKTRPWKQVLIPSLLSIKAGRAVKYIEARSEHLMAAGGAASITFDIDIIAKKDGRILGMKIHQIVDEGASISYAGAYAAMCWASVNGPYDIHNVRWDADCVVTNKAPCAPIRGVGKVMMSYALERAMEKTAKTLKIDPIELRMRNFIRESQFPYKNPSGRLYDSGNYERTFRKAMDLAEYGKMKQLQNELRKQGRIVGLGVAAHIHPASGWINSVEAIRLTMDAFGRVIASSSTPDMGTGHNTIMTQIVSEELGIKPEDITFTDIDSFHNPWTPTSGTHMSKFSGPNIEACVKAARKLKERIVNLAAILMHAIPEKLELREGQVWMRGSNKSMTIREVAKAAYEGSTMQSATMELGLEAFVATTGLLPREDLQSAHVSNYLTYGNGADICLVEIDRETFDPKILSYATVHDCGKILNLQIVEGQMHGALMNGFEAALLSKAEYSDDGQVLTQTFMDYLLATSLDLPTIKYGHTETPSPFSSLGMKGVGESGVAGPIAAIPNAIEDAFMNLGIQIESLPVTPDMIHRLLSQKNDPL